MNNLEQKQCPSILDGADEIFSKALRLPELNYQLGRKSLCIEFSKRGAIQFNALELIEKLYQRISDNWNKRMREKDPSLDNWDLRHVLWTAKGPNPCFALHRVLSQIHPAIYSLWILGTTLSAKSRLTGQFPHLLAVEPIYCLAMEQMWRSLTCLIAKP